MGTFTITTTIIGTVNGQSLSVENTFELEDVVSAIQDVGYAQLNSTGQVATFVAAGLGSRGKHDYSSVAFACFVPTTPYFTKVGLYDGTATRTHYSGMGPMIYHHGEDFNGSIGNGTGTPANDPTDEIVYFNLIPATPFEYRAIALLKPVS